MRTVILGTGSALPEKVVSNDDLSKLVDTSDEWIRQRTGIVTRHICVNETAFDLAVEAAKNGLKDAGIAPEDLDLIVVSTVSSDYRFPGLACQLQEALGCKKAMPFDIPVGCAGCVYGLDIADAFIKSGKAKYALVMGAEVLSKIMDWTDRSMCVLFGDGAGCFVVGASEDDSRGIQAILARGEGANGEALIMKDREIANPWSGKDEVKLDYAKMDGQAVFKFACKRVPESINELLKPLGVNVDEIDKFFLHQANYRIVEAVARMMKQPIEKFPTNMDHVGNISAASVPRIMDEYNKQGLLKRGEKYILCGFGAGLAYATAYVVY